MSAPDILAEIKEDLGIAAADTTLDAWLQRRIDGIWARMEVYTSRRLCIPPAKFADDWGNIVTTAGVHAMPPSITYAARGSVFLRVCPVVSIEVVETDGTPIAPANMAVEFDGRTGKLFSLRVNEMPGDLSRALRESRARIEYTAGWTDVPADLYEIVLGAIVPMYRAKTTVVPGGATMGSITGITVADVGSIEVSDANAFVSAASKAGGANDPLLGPYVNMLNIYIDHRSRIGWEGMPTTEALP